MLWRAVLKPLLFLLPAEVAHRLAFGGLRAALAIPGMRALVRRLARAEDPVLRTETFGVSFPNPVGLAAGFDKDAVGFRELAALGFGFVEVGTVTPEPQPGNPRPRLFRLERDRALVNRFGFNSRGVDAARTRLARRRTGEGVVGVNIGRNKATGEDGEVADYVRAARALAPLADYLAVNVSSPNTPGLRDLQAVERLRPILAAVRAEAAATPVLVKIAPDLSDEDVDAVADLAVELGLAGVVATNTTISRGGLATPAPDVQALGAGGVSGAPLRARSLEVLRRLHARGAGRLVLIAAGGIEDADDAWERIRAGATLVQVYTGFVYGGPGTPARIARGLADRARTSGFRSVQQASGTGAGGRPIPV